MMLFFFNDTATTEIYTLSLHDALPICVTVRPFSSVEPSGGLVRIARPSGTVSELSRRSSISKPARRRRARAERRVRSEEHTSELQSRQYLVCRLLLEKKK